MQVQPEQLQKRQVWLQMQEQIRKQEQPQKQVRLQMQQPE